MLVNVDAVVLVTVDAVVLVTVVAVGRVTVVAVDAAVLVIVDAAVLVTVVDAVSDFEQRVSVATVGRLSTKELADLYLELELETLAL